MAVVRITKELKEHILNNARLKFVDRIKAAEGSVPVGWGDYIYEKIFGSYIPIMEQLPEEFFDRKSTITVTRIAGESCSLNFSLSDSKRWPKNLPSDAPAEKNNYGDYLWLNSDLVWGELYAEVKAWKTRVNNIKAQRDEFAAGVTKVLDSFSTLSPALKAWPPLWELVPEWAKTKHKEIVERKKPDQTPELDTSKLTAVMAASKLGGI